MTDMERAQEINKDFQDWLTHAYNGTKPVETHVSFPYLISRFFHILNNILKSIIGKSAW